ncbi:phage tail sheath protein FI [Okibacterium sp. HSC-33S16]|uniref:phage tail sheath family protein n=1 Tax=Okibacterium sp. HSC-33S16 TaxID=2910965 RepID=UPI00209CE2F2|nr:phage tail sheath subtilisin-like domain-containing protein [Okibacterium sp. HSC-33S16]MCP2031706.1 phage tail sheath protein FI [Okibacterium sp. HSC-33S16]
MNADDPRGPIVRLPTAVAAFLGWTLAGPVNTPTVLTSWTEFATAFGPVEANSNLAAAVQGYFLNGGTRCHVVRVDDSAPAAAMVEARYDAALGSLDDVDDVTILCLPDLVLADGEFEAIIAVQHRALAFAEARGNCMVVLDPPSGLSVAGMSEWRTRTAFDSSHAVVYYPWINVADPASGQPRLVPPSGHVAGLWARVDAERGVNIAPTGVLHGALALAGRLTSRDHDTLRDLDVNAIRSFAARGIQVWGSSTLSTNPEWHYVSVRRLVSFLEASILRGASYAHTEPTGPALWAGIREDVNNFLLAEWRNGALVGSTPRAAFFVRCDESTHPPLVLAAGDVICQVRVAPLRPAEFVVFAVSWSPDGTSRIIE